MFGRGARTRRRAIMQISTLGSTLRSMLRLVPPATVHSVAGKWSVTFGNGRHPTSHRFLDLPPTPIQIIRSRGLAAEKFYAAGAGQQAPGSPGPGTGISFLPIGMTSFPGFGPAPFRSLQQRASRIASREDRLRHGAAAADRVAGQMRSFTRLRPRLCQRGLWTGDRFGTGPTFVTRHARGLRLPSMVGSSSATVGWMWTARCITV